MHTHLRTGNHQRVSHIITGISHIHQFNTLQTPKILSDCQKICQHLCRMILIRQPIPHRHSRIFRQFFHDFLAKATVLDSFEHTSQHSGRIRNTLFLSDLRAFRVQIGSPYSQIMSSHLKGTTSSRTGLLENQRYIFSSMTVHRNSSFFLCL